LEFLNDFAPENNTLLPLTENITFFGFKGIAVFL
jgi:hypothetical protein